jgi:hypothetical protein
MILLSVSTVFVPGLCIELMFCVYLLRGCHLSIDGMIKSSR